MKYLVLSVLLCFFVTTSTAQTKSPVVLEMQNTIGNMLHVVRNISLANTALIKNTDDQLALNLAYIAAEDLYQLFPTFGSASTSSLALPYRTQVNTMFNNFRNAVAAWETALEGRTVENLTSTFQRLQTEFLFFAGTIYSLPSQGSK